MRQWRQDHIVNILLPMALLLMFAVSALAVLLFATQTYRRTVDSAVRTGEAEMAAAYLTEKLHSFDSSGAVHLEELEDTPALALTQTRNGECYVTYIYAYDGALMEQLVKQGTTFPLSSGRPILQLRSFTLTPVRQDLLKITCTDTSGRTTWTAVAIRSEGGCVQ